jgi:MoCo/4Fe-4S cofactor protein with predicted Tat translocation signal
MNPLPSASPPPESGRAYWRSLDELSDTPEFRQWLEREFPEGASEWFDPVSRRHFVRIMSASFLLAGLGLAGTGCRRPEQKILPFSKMPENYTHGVPQYYATSMPARGGSLPLVVKSHDGRPTKIEGNALHPDSNGGTDRFAQASILNLYDPDRATRFLKDGIATTPEAALDFLATLSRQLQTGGGRKLALLVERNSSPSRERLLSLLTEKLGARVFLYEPVQTAADQLAAQQAFGRAVKPIPHYDRARTILSLDCDFLGSEDGVHNHIRRFAQGRKIEKPDDSLNRLYAVESLLTLTGANADHRLRVPSSGVALVAAAIAAHILRGDSRPQGLDQIAPPPGVDPRWILECAKDLLQHQGQSLVVAGHRQPRVVHLLAYAMNVALGNVGKTLVLNEAPPLREQNLPELARALHAGEVETLVILGCNPVATAPADLDWASAQKRARTVVRLAYYEDETAPLCTWHLPAAHFLESWGDGLAQDGSLVPVQPLIAPLFGGLTELEVLARIAGYPTSSPYEVVRETFAGFVKGANFEEAWKKFLHDGFLAGSAARPVAATYNPAPLSQALPSLQPALPSKDRLEVVFHLDYSVDDGRYNNNGWLQEMPDPITKMTWDNAVLISRKTAQELGVKNHEMVEIALGGRVTRGPIWIQPGMADYSLGLALGYGRTRTGRVGHKTGFDVYPLRTTGAEHFAVGASLKPLGTTYPLSCTQDHWSMEGRPIVREANLSQYREHPDFATRMNAEEPPVNQPLYPNPLDKLKPSALHQWGMAIDLNRCVGCSACIMACQSENNVPIVGKEQVRRGREMHWIRIDRYYAGNPAQRQYTDSYKREQQQQFEAWVDDPQVVTQPMLCQHCEAAPCENVCPVNATVHDHEGLNVMVYNRCVGTRYCSNNCPYKVRRFNYFDYNKRPITALYLGPFGRRKDDEWDLLKMVKNPDVTVRMRGVMEKCTFCTQRIEAAKIAQKVKAGATGEVVVPEGTFTTACAQACPAGAIVFGNLNDPNSRVAKLKQQDRNYSVLDLLLTKPRLTYLARVRNPNPAMPDYQEAPLSFEHFREKMGDPFKHSNTGSGQGHATGKGGH